MNLFSKYKSIFITSVLSIMIGFGSGMYFKGLQVDSAELKEVKAVQLAGFESYDLSAALTKLNADRKDAIDDKYTIIYKDVIKYVPATGNEKTCVTNSGVTVTRVLTRDAVRVLNDTETDPVQPASGSTEEGGTLTEVGMRELSEYIVTIKKQYEKLASDHDTLVEYDLWYKEKTRPDQ